MKKILLNILKSILFFSVGFTILYLVYRTQNANYVAECAQKGIPDAECSLLHKVITDFKGANYWWILVVLICFTWSNLSRAIRWNMMIRPLGYRPKISNAFFSVMLGYLANLGLPRAGEVVRAGVFSKVENIAVEKVMGTIVLDRIIDVISILIVTGLALLLEYDRIWGYFSEEFSLDEKIAGLLQSKLIWILLLLGISFLIGLFVFRKRLMQTALYQKVEGIIKGFVEGILTVRQLDRPLLFLFHSINIWLMYFLMTYFCFFSFAPTASLPMVAGLTVFVFGAWGIVIPSPGGMGTYHFLVGVALATFGVSADDAFSFANINFFSIQIGCNVLMGLLSLALVFYLNRNYTPKAIQTNN